MQKVCYLDSCPKNDVILFSQKSFCALRWVYTERDRGCGVGISKTNWSRIPRSLSRSV